MANLTATSAWSDVLQLETTHQAIGGAGGTMNLQAQSLINRTQYLADNKFNTADFLTTLKTNLNASGTAPVYACRAWVSFNGSTTTITINGSANVSSITDNGVGNYVVNFTTAMPDANYSVAATGDTSGSNGGRSLQYNSDLTPRTISSVALHHRQGNSASNVDAVNASVIIFR